MAYESKTWVDRVTENPNRRRLEDTGITDTYDVVRDEGVITAEGDKINATNLNGLETRVGTAFTAMGIDTYSCTKTGTVYDLKNIHSPTNGKFQAVADYTEGDTFRINPTDQFFNHDNAVAGFINNTNGTLNASAVGNYSSPLIIISPSVAYKIVGHTYTQPVASVGLAWYDSTGAYISGVNYGGATGNGTYTAPATAYYVRYTINTIDLTVSLFELNSSTNTDVTYTSATTAILPNGDFLPNEAFKTDSWLPFIYDSENDKLNFISAGGAFELPNYAGKLIVHVASSDSGNVDGTKVRIRNEQLGSNYVQTIDALGNTTFSLLDNHTYYVVLLDYPSSYYGTAATVTITGGETQELTLTLDTTPHIVGWRMNIDTGIVEYTDGAADFEPMTVESGVFHAGSWENQWAAN
ncbi:MAG: hypothetical protein M0R51_12080, partial [Clostridia bacterium]|nr:hypothetical protein [Clostridia bacterium]